MESSGSRGKRLLSWRLLWLHALLSALIYAIVFIYCIFKFDEAILAFVYSITVTLFYLFVGFFNCYFLIPRVFTRHKAIYALFAVVLIAGATLLRVVVEHFLFYEWMGYRWFFNYSSEHFSFSFVTILVAFLFGALLRIALDHMSLLHLEQQRKSQHIISELNLLKSQVQPHFLFNALNNIYYLTFINSEKAPESILRLSDTMRYFVEEAPKEFVSLETEMDFIRDYIEVERIRLPKPLWVEWHSVGINGNSILIPPMLFIPFVENVFKHGIDKTIENRFDVTVTADRNVLTYRVENAIHQRPLAASGGTGLNNLRKRLELLYGPRSTVKCVQTGERFVSELTVPLI